MDRRGGPGIIAPPHGNSMHTHNIFQRASIGLLGSCLLASSLVALDAHAQLSIPYAVSEYAENYSARSGGSSVPFADSDNSQAAVTIPFAFKFFRQTYTSVNIGTNGFV